MAEQDANWPAMDTRPLELAELIPDELRLIRRLQTCLRQMHEDSARLPARPTRTQPWAEAIPGRTHRAVLLDGGRGTGKTSLLLTLLQGWHPEHLLTDATARELFEPPRRFLRALPLLDFDPLPDHLHAYAWFVQALEPLVSAVEAKTGRGGGRDDWLGFGEERLCPPRGSGADLQPGLREEWRRIHDQAILGWDAELLPRTLARDLDEFSLEQCERQRGWLQLQESWRRFLDRLLCELETAQLLPERGLLVLPVDDLDLHPDRTEELLLALRLYWHPRLAVLLAGDGTRLQEVLTLQLLRKERRLAVVRRAHQERRAELLAEDLLNKVIPPGHRFPIPKLTFLELLPWSLGREVNLLEALEGQGASFDEPLTAAGREQKQLLLDLLWEVRRRQRKSELPPDQEQQLAEARAHSIMQSIGFSRKGFFRFRGASLLRALDQQSWLKGLEELFYDELRRAGSDPAAQAPDGAAAQVVLLRRGWHTFQDHDVDCVRVAEFLDLETDRSTVSMEPGARETERLSDLILIAADLDLHLPQLDRLQWPTDAWSPMLNSLWPAPWGDQLILEWPVRQQPTSPWEVRARLRRLRRPALNDLRELLPAWIQMQVDRPGTSPELPFLPQLGELKSTLSQVLQRESRTARGYGRSLEQSWWLAWLPVLAAPEYRLPSDQQSWLLQTARELLTEHGLAARWDEFCGRWQTHRQMGLRRVIQQSGVEEPRQAQRLAELEAQIARTHPDAPWFREVSSPRIRTWLDWKLGDGTACSQLLISFYRSQFSFPAQLLNLLNAWSGDRGSPTGPPGRLPRSCGSITNPKPGWPVWRRSAPGSPRTPRPCSCRRSGSCSSGCFR